MEGFHLIFTLLIDGYLWKWDCCIDANLHSNWCFSRTTSLFCEGTVSDNMRPRVKNIHIDTFMSKSSIVCVIVFNVHWYLIAKCFFAGSAMDLGRDVNNFRFEAFGRKSSERIWIWNDLLLENVMHFTSLTREEYFISVKQCLLKA